MTTTSLPIFTTQAAAALASMTLADIGQVYSGRPGCACGCKGSYSYNKAIAADVTAKRGIKVTANDRQVNKVLGILKAAPMCQVEFGSTYISVDVVTGFDSHGNARIRVYTAYVMADKD